MRKAQAAMEFLMTYGWAILVVLVAIGALAYFGVLSPAQFLPEKCIISSGSGLFCSDYSASAVSKITLQVKNILDKQVIILAGGVVVKYNNGANTCTGAAATIPADGTLNIVVATGATCTMAAGDKIKGDITITYQPTGGLLKTTTGQLITTASA